MQKYASFTRLCTKGHGFIYDGMVCPWCFGNTCKLICKCCGEAKKYSGFALHDCKVLPTSVIIRSTVKTASFSLDGDFLQYKFEKMFSLHFENGIRFRDYIFKHYMILEPIDNNYDNTPCFYEISISSTYCHVHVEKFTLKRVTRRDDQHPVEFVNTQLQVFKNSKCSAPALEVSPNMPYKYITMYSNPEDLTYVYIEYAHSLYEFLSERKCLRLYCIFQKQFISNVIELAHCSDTYIKSEFCFKENIKCLIEKAIIKMTSDTGMATPSAKISIDVPFVGLAVYSIFCLKNLLTSKKDNIKEDPKKEEKEETLLVDDTNEDPINE